MPPRSTRTRSSKAKAAKESLAASTPDNARSVGVKLEKEDTPIAPSPRADPDAVAVTTDGRVARGRPRKSVPKSVPIVDTDTEAEDVASKSAADAPVAKDSSHAAENTSADAEGAAVSDSDSVSVEEAAKKRKNTKSTYQSRGRAVDIENKVDHVRGGKKQHVAVKKEADDRSARSQKGRVLVPDSDSENADVYDGKDLDKYDSSFIDDEAEDVDDAEATDNSDRRSAPDVERDVHSDADDVNVMGDQDSTDDDTDKLPMSVIRRALPSPAAYDPNTTPKSPVKSKKSMLTETPLTPSPIKDTTAARRKRSSRPSDVMPSPTSKSRRLEVNSDSDNHELSDASERPSIAAIIKEHKAKLEAKGIVTTPLKPTPKRSTDVPVTPKKEDVKSGISLDPPDTPGTRLAKELSNLETCEVLRQCQDNLDPLLHYEGLPKLRSWGSFDDNGKFMLAAFYQAIIEGHGLTESQYAKHADKASRMVETPAFGPGFELQNLARQGVGEFMVAKEKGYSDNATHYLRRVGPDGPHDCAFITFGVVSEDSHLLEPHAFGEWQSKSVSIWPLDVEFPRQVSAAQQLFEAYHRDTSPRTRAGLPQLAIRTFNGAVSFGTRIQGVTSSSRRLPRGIGAPRGARNYTPEQLRHFFEDIFVPQMKRPLLATGTNIPIFDASDIFKGENVDWKFDFTNVGKTCAPLYEELSSGDYIAVVHSVLHSEIKHEPTMQFGVYYAVLLSKSAEHF